MLQKIQIVASMALIVALFATGCGSDWDAAEGSKPPDYEKALAGAPPRLAALYAEANELLPGGVDAYEERIAGLRGHPVVVNLWGAWCGPCRYEFPDFQQLSAEYGTRVAFLGVDVEDNEDYAKTFLESAPVPYPSYSDPDGDIVKSVHGGGLPNTAFYNRRGELVYLKIGQYKDRASLRADIERCALGDPSGCPG